VANRGRPKNISLELVAEAAADLFLEKGYQNTSVDDIATRCGISRATFFNYFPTKADVLFVEVDRLLDRLSESLDSGTPVIEALHDLARQITPAELPLIATHADTMDATADVSRVGPARIERLRAQIARWHPDPFDQWILTGAVVSAVTSWAGNPRESSLDTVLASALDRVRGL
jgi:AcrR family transcriptional regulator